MKFLTFVSTQAFRRFIVPSILVFANSKAFSIELSTWDSAAKWITFEILYLLNISLIWSEFILFPELEKFPLILTFSFFFFEIKNLASPKFGCFFSSLRK